MKTIARILIAAFLALPFIAVSQVSNQQVLSQIPGAYQRTSAEVSAGVTIVNYGYLPGNVWRYGGNAGGDVSTAFQRAVNALPSGGGFIDVPDGAYVINTAPTWGTKSVLWRFGPNATVTGSQTTFPRMNTNTAQVPVGPWIQSQSTVASPAGGGIAALNAEMIQPATYVGQSVALYAGARGSNSSASANVWAMNPLVQADTGAGGTYQGIEVDANNFSAAALVKGISINGVGNQNASVGLEIIRTSNSWNSGITINNAGLGISIGTTGLSRGISIGNPLVFGNSLISGKQLANGSDALIFQRNTDTSPTGYYWRLVNAANSATVVGADTTGQMLWGTGATPNIGIDLSAATIAFQGVRVGNTPSTQVAGVGARQFANGQAAIFLQRFTDTAPTGNLIQAVNAANNAVIASIDASGNIVAQNITAVGTLTLSMFTVAALPTCNAGGKGALLAVSDATAPTYNAALTGGGAVSIPVYCNGSAWTAH